MSLLQLIYVSHLRGEENVLGSIHSHAVRNNTAHTVTGMLLYSNGRFLQVLEGETKDVHDTFDKIKDDPRHDQITVLLVEPITERTFQHWNMGFKQLKKEELAKFPAYIQYFEDDFGSLKANPSVALDMLKEFQ